MLYKNDWDEIKKRYLEYWALENHDRPLLAVTAPKNQAGSGVQSENPRSLKQRWFDLEWILKSVNKQFQNTYFGAEALPIFSPNLGPDFFASLYGVDLEFAPDTSWAQYHQVDFDVYGERAIDQANNYYRHMIAMTSAAAEDGRDKYLVGVTDLHPGADALVSLCGPEQLCLDTLERPEDVKKTILDLFAGFKQIYTELSQITMRYQQGTSNWMRVWHPGRWYVTSCDFAALISNDMFRELILDELLAELDFLDASLFHLDGPDALRHLDTLLEIESLNGIQWVYGAGQPTASHWLDVLKKIQAAGKMIHVEIVPADLDCLLENLRPEGVLYSLSASSQEEAEALIRRVSQYKKRLF